MEISDFHTIASDVLIIGSGAAGLRAAIEARKHQLEVLLVSESPIGFKNNTAIAGGCFATTGIWKGTGDSPKVHIRDTVIGGRFLNDRRLVSIMAEHAEQQVHDLMNFGVNLARTDGELFVKRLPGHTSPRSVCAASFKGINITRPMSKYAASVGVRFIKDILVSRLLKSDNTVVGALGINSAGQLFMFNAKSTILATGGAGQIFLRTNNALGLTGDGYSLAFEVGAKLRDMEFVQFYPTGWGKQGSKPCPYEKFLPRGAIIKNSLGENILLKHGLDNVALVTRDILTRVIMEEIYKGRGVEDNVIFDLTTIPEEEAQQLYYSGQIHKGSYPSEILVAPTAHFSIGGVKFNEASETGVNGLYAAGEVCGGVHGANRLGNNAITEALVFGSIAGDRAATRASKMTSAPSAQSEATAEVTRLRELFSKRGKEKVEELQHYLKQIMWHKVGVIRNGKELEDAYREILALRGRLGSISPVDHRQLCKVIKLDNMVTVSAMVCRAALTRTESRGAHYRTDYPEQSDEQWLKTIEIYRRDKEMILEVVPLTNGSFLDLN